MKTADVVKDNILDHIRSVGENSKNCKLSAAFYDKYCVSIERISVYFGITPFQSVFIANVILRNLSEKPARFLDLAEYFKYPPTRFLEHLNDINDLVGRNMITKIKNDNQIYHCPCQHSHLIICGKVLWMQFCKVGH